MKNRRVVQLLIALAVADAAAGLLRAQTAAVPTAAVPTTDIPALRTALYDPAARPDQREQAAARLLSRPDPAARTVIRVALSEVGQPAVQLAAARALATTPTPDPTLVTPLLALLEPTSPDPLLDATGRALSAYKTDADVLTRLLGLTAAPDERVRVVAIRSAGTFVDKRVADALVPLVDPATNPTRVTRAASSALAYLSGLDASTDAAGWQTWWTANRGKTDAQFQADLASARSARYDTARQRVTELEDEVGRTLADVYQKAPRDAKVDLLVRYLRSPEPSVRVAGARIARQSAETGDVTPQPIREQLRQLIGDASPAVRYNAAEALALINDADAVVPLLTQLNQETDTAVRAALANALRPTRDLRAVPVLLKLLDDPSIETAQAVADSLGELGERLRQADPALADRAADKMVQVLQARSTPQNNVDFRNALVQAVGPLQSRAAAGVLVRMLNAPAEDRRVRRSLLVAVGRYRDAQFTDSIAAWMGDEDPAIRLAAVRALGESAVNFGDVERPLRERTDPEKEKQAEIRDAAWRVLTVLFTKAPADQLGLWEMRLKDDPARLIVVLTELRNRARLANESAKAAERDRQLGDANMQAERFAAAIVAYKAAFDFAQANNRPGSVELISEGLIQAYLKNRQYEQAVTFAQQTIGQNAAFAGNLGSKIRLEADHLVATYDFASATQLIDLALKMNPQLPPRYAEQLQNLQAQVKARFNKQNQMPYPPVDAVQSASWVRPQI